MIWGPPWKPLYVTGAFSLKIIYLLFVIIGDLEICVSIYYWSINETKRKNLKYVEYRSSMLFSNKKLSLAQVKVMFSFGIESEKIAWVEGYAPINVKPEVGVGWGVGLTTEIWSWGLSPG